MGLFDGAKICELVGLVLFSELASIIGKNKVDLYRDDGLAILENTPGPDMECVKKNKSLDFLAKWSKNFY